MEYRIATQADYEQIATLHTQSWRQTYRGILRDEYLDGDILQDRLAVWRERLHQPEANQQIFVVDNGDQLLGFVCLFGDDDSQWGTLVDNLHVSQAVKGQGIGKKLLQKAANWTLVHQHHPGIYLWVYEDNQAARRFYENLGAENAEMQVKENPGGGTARTFRYVWRLAETLL